MNQTISSNVAELRADLEQNAALYELLKAKTGLIAAELAAIQLQEQNHEGSDTPHSEALHAAFDMLTADEVPDYASALHYLDEFARIDEPLMPCHPVTSRTWSR